MIMISRLRYVEHLGPIILQLLQKSPVMVQYPEHQVEVNKIINLPVSVMSRVMVIVIVCLNTICIHFRTAVGIVEEAV